MFRQFQNLALEEAFFSFKMLYLQLGRTDVRISKRSFNFCHCQKYETLFSNILLYSQLNCPHKSGMGFKFWSSWGVAPMIFKITLLSRYFSINASPLQRRSFVFLRPNCRVNFFVPIFFKGFLM